MENNHNGDIVRVSADHQNEWQHAEKSDTKNVADTDGAFDMRSAEANGYGTKEDESEDADEDDSNDVDDDVTLSDWGDVDPQNNGIPSSNDPTAPGSAV